METLTIIGFLSKVNNVNNNINNNNNNNKYNNKCARSNIYIIVLYTLREFCCFY